MKLILIKMEVNVAVLVTEIYTIPLQPCIPYCSHTYRNNLLSPGEAFISSQHTTQLCFFRSPSGATWSLGLKSGQMPLLSLGMAVPRGLMEDGLVFISWWWQVPLWRLGFSAYRNSSAPSEFRSIKPLNVSAVRPHGGARDGENDRKGSEITRPSKTNSLHLFWSLNEKFFSFTHQTWFSLYLQHQWHWIDGTHQDESHLKLSSVLLPAPTVWWRHPPLPQTSGKT